MPQKITLETRSVLDTHTLVLCVEREAFHL